MTWSCRSRAIRSRSVRTSSSRIRRCDVGELPGQRRLVGEGGHHLELFSAERVCTFVPECNHNAGDGVAGAKGQHKRRTDAGTDPEVDVVESTWSAVPEGLSNQRCAYRNRPLRQPDRLPRRPIATTTSSTTSEVGEVNVGRNGHHRGLCASQFQRFVRNEPEHSGRVGAGQQLGGDVPGCLDPRLSGPGLLIEPGVVDRDTGCRGEGFDQYLVVFAERLSVVFSVR